MQPLRIDHVSVAGSDHDTLRERWQQWGFRPQYGGSHGGEREDDVTEMSTIGCADGTYVELLSTVGSATPPIWERHVRADGGPCSWSIRCPDPALVADQLADRGIHTSDPISYTRTRPDGTTLSWDVVFLGDHEPGAVLPFLVHRRSPDETIVPAATTDGALGGVERVIVAVSDLEAAVEQCQTALGLQTPVTGDTEALDATVAHFPRALSLATPADDAGWVADRLATVGPSPCCFLFAHDEDSSLPSRFEVTGRDRLFGEPVAWIGSKTPATGRVGILVNSK